MSTLPTEFSTIVGWNPLLEGVAHAGGLVLAIADSQQSMVT
jgi:hypothetical protein